MRKTFQDLKNNVAAEVHDTSTNMLNLIGNYINRRYFDILRRINWNISNYDYTITTVAGQKDYALPQDFHHAIGASIPTANRELQELDSINALYHSFTDEINSTGDPYRYVIFEDVVQTQPSSASQVTVVSSNSADTTQQVLVRGISNNAEITEAVTLNGTSSQTTSASFTRIKGISKDGDTTGYITVTAGSDTLSILNPKDKVARYKVVRLHPTPTTALTVNLPYSIKPYSLVEDEDYAIIDIDDALEVGARADALRYKKRDAAASNSEVLYEKMIVDYIWDKENKPNQVPQFIATPYSRETAGFSSRYDGNNT